jgi:hypothetical protein
MGRGRLAVLEADALANVRDQRAPLPVEILHTRERSGVSRKEGLGMARRRGYPCGRACRGASRRDGKGIGIRGWQPAAGRRTVFTIGHSNHSAAKFIRLLEVYGIEILVDIRSHPYSRHAPRFNASALEAALSSDGIGYLFLGGELGGRPEGEEFYDEKGRVDYALFGCSRPFLDGISRLEKEVRTRTVALLCSEENPTRCHRRLLVGRALQEQGITLRHIRGDCSVETEDEMNGSQPVLFPEAEASTRKSIRSVSRRRRRPNSSRP